MTASLGSETSGAHRWQDVTVLVISIAGIRSNSGLASVEDVMGPSPARRHHARDLHHCDPEHQGLV